MKLPLGRVAVIILFFSVVYNALFVHVGDHVLITLPQWPLIGGAITYEAIVDGARNGIMLLTLLAIFVAFNTVIPASDLVRMTPPALKDIGVVILVAITYVPETRRQLGRIREAQAIRGHELHGLKDWRPVLVPLLVAGFERSLHLSETMVARGYGSVSTEHHGRGKRAALLVSMISAFAGWVLLLAGFLIGWVFIIGSVLFVVIIALSENKEIRRTKYRSHSWHLRDWLMILVAAASLAVVFIPMVFVDRSTLFYSPYQSLALPEFDLVIGLALVLLAVPVLINIKSVKETDIDD